jgi:hypothetical protein
VGERRRIEEKRERRGRGRGREGEKEEKRKRNEEKRRYIRPVRLRVCAKTTEACRMPCPPQASLFLKETALCTK